ncbi:hypothetical protein J2S78_003005 [Salibacterium salarium]|uniref:hypothetical protein n=1 Tax=Salibacterium salarium TaxID=284579 RepID=UPI0027860833|nr:hypothetical protein [Salibacterium salarium]MDQ0300537.1 hypothetical protein [Salibacterium salarium]
MLHTFSTHEPIREGGLGDISSSNHQRCLVLWTAAPSSGKPRLCASLVHPLSSWRIVIRPALVWIGSGCGKDVGVVEQVKNPLQSKFLPKKQELLRMHYPGIMNC